MPHVGNDSEKGCSFQEWVQNKSPVKDKAHLVPNKGRPCVVVHHAACEIEKESVLAPGIEQNQRRDAKPIGSESRQIQNVGTKLRTVQIHIGVNISSVVVPSVMLLLQQSTKR